MTLQEWRVHLSDEARGDYLQILDWTAERFGHQQADAYEVLLIDVIQSLTSGPAVPGTRRRADLGKGIISLRMVAKGRHVLFLRAMKQTNQSKFSAFCTMEWISHVISNGAKSG